MSRIARSASFALAPFLVWLSALAPASAQGNPNRDDYGYCQGVAGTNPSVEFVTQTFKLGKQNLGGRHAAYMAELKRRFNETFPRETGCSMSQTAAEAQAKRQELIDGVKNAMGPQSVVVLDWIPEGATALPGGPGPTPMPVPATASTAAATAPPNPAMSQSDYVAHMPGPFWACTASANGVQHRG